MLTTDLGGQAPGDPGNGQFIVWFGEAEGTDQTYCKVDIEVATAQSILVGPDDEVYVVSARPPSSGRLALHRPAHVGRRRRRVRGHRQHRGAAGRHGHPGAGAAPRPERRPARPRASPSAPKAASTCPAWSPAMINEYDADWQLRAHDPGPARGRDDRRRHVTVDGHAAGHRGHPGRDDLVRRHRHRERPRERLRAGRRHGHRPPDPLRRRRAPAPGDAGRGHWPSPTASASTCPVAPRAAE